MANVVKIQPGQLGAYLKAQVKGQKKAIGLGVKLGAHRGLAYLTPRFPVFDGQLKNSGEVLTNVEDANAKIVFSAPHAGIVERGARPHKLGREAINAIYEWIVRKMLAGYVTQITRGKNKGKDRAMTREEREDAAKTILWAVVRKIERDGLKPTYIVRDSLPTLAQLLDAEVADQLNKFFSGGP